MLKILVDKVSKAIPAETRRYYFEDDLWNLLANDLCRKSLSDSEKNQVAGVMGEIVRRSLLKNILRGLVDERESMCD